MKDAIIVRKVTGPFSHEWNDWSRRDEETNGIIFDYSVTDPRTGFSWRKDHAPNQKTRTEGNSLLLKESRTKIRRRNKKRTNRFSQGTRARNHRFCESPKSESRIRAD